MKFKTINISHFQDYYKVFVKRNSSMKYRYDKMFGRNGIQNINEQGNMCITAHR